MSKAKQDKPTYAYAEGARTGDYKRLEFRNGTLEVEMEKDSCCQGMYSYLDLSSEETRKLYEVMKEYYD